MQLAAKIVLITLDYFTEIYLSTTEIFGAFSRALGIQVVIVSITTFSENTNDYLLVHVWFCHPECFEGDGSQTNQIL